ncbi:LRR receptor-like serine/threonine-protein kinase RKF3 [Pyrus ussuriensis x Pyrus communis]|uniref:LRR receptor-like serine/threonine-protein kinase RKF3 n=1 Tax=Pyrus ussuriensis x Pyrus communis TaxID=2448454 RepID=A0A5N5H9F5_9ROSA|nr:LRR receptor-like serine/threonine-protein kinase RKF3 [Pyrus ussuriensis x Pyrus communis]
MAIHFRETSCRRRHPAGLGGVGWGEEVAGAAEVLEVDEAKALDEVLASGVEIVTAAVMGDHSLISNPRELRQYSLGGPTKLQLHRAPTMTFVLQTFEEGPALAVVRFL